MNIYVEIFVVIIQAILAVLAICVIGIILTRHGVLSKDTSSSLSKIAFNCFLPSLLFTNISKGIDINHLAQMGMIALFAVIYILLSFLCGLLLKLILKPEDDFKGGLVTATAFGNTVTIPIALITTLSDAPPFRGYPNPIGHALGFISIYSIISSAAQWGIGLNYLKSQARLFHEAEQITEISVSSEEEQQPPVDQNQSFEQLEQRLESEAKCKTMKAIRDKCCKGLRYERWKEIFERYISPPFIANMLGIIIGLSPIKDYLYEPQSLFRWVGHALILLGQAQVPVVLLILGVNMAKKPDEPLKKSFIFGVIFVRLILFPWIGIGLTRLALYFNLIHNNPVLLFVLMLEAGTPPALNLVVMSHLVNMGQGKMALLQFWAYAFSILSLTAYGTLYLYLVS